MKESYPRNNITGQHLDRCIYAVYVKKDGCLVRVDPQIMFWVQFDKSVIEDDILNFMKGHLSAQGTFISCGRFAKRVIGFYNVRTTEWSKEECWCYFAATREAADADLQRWSCDNNPFDGIDGERYQAYRTELKRLGKI